MKKIIIFFVCLMLVTVSAHALPAGYDWVDADYWTISDLSGSQGTFELIYENSGAVYESSFGLYTVNDAGDTVVAKHEVFSADQEPSTDIYGGLTTASSVWFKLDGSSWKISNSEFGTYSDFGKTFGFYFDIFTNGYDDGSPDYTWFTDVQFNSNGSATEHIFTAYSGDPNRITNIFLEDRAAGYVDGDPLDMMVKTDDLQPVPEPATLLLLGSGLVGLAYVRRRKN